MYKKFMLVTVLIIITSIVIVGCWSKIELDERALVMGIGIDKTEEEQVLLTVQILLPTEHGGVAKNGGGEDSIWVLQSKGSTIFDATRNFVMKTGRDIFWQYSDMIVIGEKAAQGELEQILDAVVRDRDARLNQYVLIADGEASEILEATHEQQFIPSDAIAEMVKAQKNLGKSGIGITLLEFTQQIKSPGKVAHAPIITLNDQKNDEQGKDDDDLEEGPNDESDSGSDDEELKMKGVAIFDQHDRLASFLSPEDSRGVDWVLGDLESTLIVVPEKVEGGGNLGVELLNLDSEIYPKILENGLPRVKLTFTMDGLLGEKQPSLNLSIEDYKPVLEEKTAKVIENEIYSALNVTQEMEADVYGFGEEFHNRHPEYWNAVKEQWPELYSEMIVELDIEMNIRRTGLIRDRFDI